MYFPRQDDTGHFAWLQQRKARIVAANPHFALKILGAPSPDRDLDLPLPRPVLAGEGYIGGRKRKRRSRRHRGQQFPSPPPLPPALCELAERVAAACGVTVAALAATPGMAHAGFIVMGVGASVIAPTAFSLVGRLASPEARGRAVARATLYGYFGYFVGPPALGALAGSLGLRAAFVAAALILLLVPVLARLMARAAR